MSSFLCSLHFIHVLAALRMVKENKLHFAMTCIKSYEVFRRFLKTVIHQVWRELWKKLIDLCFFWAGMRHKAVFGKGPIFMHTSVQNLHVRLFEWNSCQNQVRTRNVFVLCHVLEKHWECSSSQDEERKIS